MIDAKSPLTALGLSSTTLGYLTKSKLFPTVGDLASAGLATVGEVAGITGTRLTEITQKLAEAGYRWGRPLPVLDPDPPPADPAGAAIYWERQAGRALEVLVAVLQESPGQELRIDSCESDQAAARRVVLVAQDAGGYVVRLETEAP